MHIERADHRRARVLMILEAAAYPAAKGGGAENQVRVLCRALREAGHRCCVLVPLTPESPPERIARVDGVPVIRIPYPHVRLLGSLVLWWRVALFLLTRGRRYDAWHTHIAHHMAAVAAFVAPRRIPVLHKVSGWWELERGLLAPGLLRRIGFRMLDRRSHWIAISSRIAKELASRGVPASRIAEIANTVNVRKFAAVKPEEGPAARFLFIGRLVPEKGLPELIEAFASIAAEHPDATLSLVGAGVLEQQLRDDIAARGLQSRVRLLGHRNDIEQLMTLHNIGVLPSRLEGLSNTLLETMASGMPMVASRISGNEDFVEHGRNGWLFDHGDAAAFAACMNAAAAATAEARHVLGERARSMVCQRAAPDVVVAQLLRLYLSRSRTASADARSDEALRHA